jgi:hypothetical protein
MLSENDAVKVCNSPSQEMFESVYDIGLVKGAAIDAETGGFAVISVIVRTPVTGLFENSITP